MGATKSERIKWRRLQLWSERGGLCHWCGIKTILPQKYEPFPSPRMATLDHLIDRNIDPTRSRRGGLKKVVLSCYRCNQTRAVESRQLVQAANEKRLPTQVEPRDLCEASPPPPLVSA